MVGTRATRARAFLVEKGMHIPSGVIYYATSHATQLAPAHRNLRSAWLDPGRPSHAWGLSMRRSCLRC